MTLTAAIVAALCAVTLLVFAGGKDEPAPGPAPAPEANSPISACQTATGSSCVQAAKDIVSGSSSSMPAAPAETRLP